MQKPIFPSTTTDYAQRFNAIILIHIRTRVYGCNLCELNRLRANRRLNFSF